MQCGVYKYRKLTKNHRNIPTTTWNNQTTEHQKLRRTKLPGLRADMLECLAIRTQISGVDTRSFLQPPEDSAIHS